MSQPSPASTTKLTVVLPTYNEAGQIERTLRYLSKTILHVGHEMIVVDDDSPDGTFAKVEALARENPAIRGIRRVGERGLSGAVIEGFRAARGEFLAVMDSDGQHPPATVLDLLSVAVIEKADLVVASRLVDRGSAPGLSPLRRAVSLGARLVVKLCLPAVRRHRVRDTMSGFFLVRKDRLPPLEGLRKSGYKILLEILAKADLQRVFEVGYRFENRRGGRSKLGLRNQVDFIRHVAGLALRDRENLRLLAFSMVGFSGVFVNLVPMAVADWVFHESGAIRLIYWAISARELAVLWNFAWNDAVTFRDLRGATRRGWFARFLRFHVPTFGSFVVYLGLFGVLVRLGFPLLLATSVAIAAGLLVNYVGSRRWSYAPRPRNPPPHVLAESRGEPTRP